MAKIKPCEKFDILPTGGCSCLSQMSSEERREEVGKAATKKLILENGSVVKFLQPEELK